MNIAIIPARGGSRRIPRKNIRLFHGKPIIAYSIAAAKDPVGGFPLFDTVYVSSDDPEILDIAHELYAVPLKRSPELALDEVGTQEVVRKVVEQLKELPLKLVCCIYPTAPMLTVDDLRRGRDALNHREARFSFAVGDDPLQDAGQFYWGHAEAFRKGEQLIAEHTAMVPIDRRRVCDINIEEDWQRAERMYLDLQHRRAA